MVAVVDKPLINQPQLMPIIDWMQWQIQLQHLAASANDSEPAVCSPGSHPKVSDLQEAVAVDCSKHQSLQHPKCRHKHKGDPLSHAELALDLAMQPS